MTKALSIRIPLVAAIIALAALMFSTVGTQEAQARGPKSKAAAVKKGSNKKSKKGDRVARRSRGRRHHARRYTVRGNPEVTRAVATALLAEKLPELAALVGIQAPPREEGASTSQSVSETQILAPRRVALSSTGNPYDDSELNEEEDADAITAEDYDELEELPTDINSFYKEFTKYMASLNGEPTITDNGVDKVAVMEALMDWVGTRYLFGGMGRNGIDCSAFTGTIYRALNFRLPRTAAMQWEVGLPVAKEDLQFGDLVFFHTRAAVYVSHVGMYLGNGMFAHASSRNGVTVSPLDGNYYSTHFIGARRYDLNAAMAASAEIDTSTHN